MVPWFSLVATSSNDRICFHRLILCAGYLGVFLSNHQLGWGGSERPLTGTNKGIETWFVRWDSMYYWEIAKQGYSTQGIERAFFPLYSAICGILSKLTSIPVFWVGLILSIGSFAGSGLVLFKLVLHDSGHHAALFSVLWLCISPMAFFFISFYLMGQCHRLGVRR